MKKFQKSLQNLVEQFGTDFEKGLSQSQAQERLLSDGPNAVKKALGRSLLRIFLGQFHDPLIYLLLASGSLIYYVGDEFDAYIILGILLLNAIIGSLQEMRIALVVDKLKDFSPSYTMVLREGVRRTISSTLLVAGDILILQEGERIPTDGIIVEEYGLSVDESMLTGESEAIVKEMGTQIFSGSYVLSGYGKAVVIATGKRTRLGAIHRIIETTSTDMPLQKDLLGLLHFVLMAIVAICLSLLLIGVVTGRPFGQLLAALTALFICVLPQGLPVIMTVVLVSGAYRMARKKVFSKRLQAVEALGRADVVIMDKTGTLTRNELMVTTVIAGNDLFEVTGQGYSQKGIITRNAEVVTECTASQELSLMAQAAAILDRSEIIHMPFKKGFSVKGSSVQAAMRVFAHKLGFERAEVAADYKMLYEIPFNSQHQYHAGFLERDGKGIVFGLGSPEVIMARCKTVSQKQVQHLQVLLKKGLRVIAVCYKEFDLAILKADSHDSFERSFVDLKLLGFYALEDSLRKESSSIVGGLRRAGMKVVMATGDNHETAMYLARASGIMRSGDSAIEGAMLQESVDEEILKQLDKVTVFSRVMPEDKARIVRLFQQRGAIVAMVGDGVNDAPALASAQLGIAMGNTGSDVAREAADIVLLDDSFASILPGVEQGRHIFISFKRVILYFFTTNFSEVTMMLFAFAINLPLPLLASQILWLNLVTDGFLDFALAMEPHEPGLLRSRWVQERHTLITRPLIARIVYQALMVAVIAGLQFYYTHRSDLMLARTLTMVTMTSCYWFMALNCRSLHLSVVTLGFWSNRWLAGALFVIPLLLVAILYTTWGRLVFQVVPLEWYHWKRVLLIGFSVLAVEELRKLIARSN